MLEAITDLRLFIVAGLLLNLTPGADIAYTVARGAAQGPRAAVVAALGIGGGCLFHVTLATLGISAALAASELAFGVLKLLGAGYLAWLGWQLLRAAVVAWRRSGAGPDAAGAAPARAAPPSLARVFRDGVLINAMNPKVALFFIAFLPQFVHADAPGKAAALWLLGLIFTVNGTLVTAAIGLAAALATRRLGAPRRLGALLQGLLGLGFVALALRLAWSGRQ